ncbi:hypothetical protein AB205_0055620, partial [Aquarana catesbeiana]
MADTITEVSVSEEKVKTPKEETESEGWKLPSFRLPKLSLFGTSEIKADGFSKEISPEGESKITETEVVIESTSTTSEITDSITKSKECVYITETSMDSILVEGKEKSLKEMQTEQSEIIVSKATSEIIDIDMHELVTDILIAQEREEAEHVHLESAIKTPSTEEAESEPMEIVAEKEYIEEEKSEASEQLPIPQETDTDKKLKVEVDEIVTEDVDKESPTESMKVKGKAKKHRKKITKVEKTITTVKTAAVEAISPTPELHQTTPENKTVAEEGEVKEVSPQTQVTVSVYKEQVQVSTPTTETTTVEVAVKPEEGVEKVETVEDVSMVLSEVATMVIEEEERSFGWKLPTFKIPLFSATDITAESSVDESKVAAPQTFSETALQKFTEEISTVKAEITAYKTEKEETKDNLDTAGTITEISVSEEKVKTPEEKTESEGWKFPPFRLPKLSLFGTSEEKAEGSSKEISPEEESKITDTEVVIESTSTTSEITDSITKSEECVYITETSVESILVEGKEKSLQEFQTEQSEIIVSKVNSEIIDIGMPELVTDILTAQEREEAEHVHLESAIKTPSTEEAESEPMEIVAEKEYIEEEKSEASEQLPIPQKTDTDKKLKVEVDEIVTEDVDKESPTDSMKVKGKAKKHRKKITKVEKTITTVKIAAVEAISPTLELHRTTPEIKTVEEEGELKEVSPQTQVTVSVYKEQVQVSTPTIETTTVEVAVKPEEGVEKAETVEDVSMVLSEVATTEIEEEERSFGWKLPTFKIPLFSAQDVPTESSVDEPREANSQSVAETALQKSTEEISTLKAEITIYEAEKEETKDNVDMADTITEISVSEEKVKTPKEATESEAWKLPSFRLPKLSLFGTSEIKADGLSKEISPKCESKTTEKEVVIESTSTTSEIADSITNSEEFVYIPETSMENILVEGQEKSLEEWQTEQSEIIVLKTTSEIVDIDRHELVTYVLTAQEREEAEPVHLESSIETPSTETAKSETMEVVVEKEYTEEEKYEASEQLPISQETDTDKKLKVEVDEILTEDVDVDKESPTDSIKVKGKAKKHRKKITKVEKTITTVKTAAVEAISPTPELHRTTPEIKTVAEEGEVMEVSPQTQVTVSVYKEQVQVSTPTTETTTDEVAVKLEEDVEKAETVEDVAMVLSEVATTVLEEEERIFEWKLPTFKIPLFSATDITAESSVDEPREATSQTVAGTALQKSTEKISTVKSEITTYKAEKEEIKDNFYMADTITEISVSEEKVKTPEDETESEGRKLPSFRLPKLSLFGTSEVKADGFSKEISQKCESKITEKEVVIESPSTTSEIAESMTKSEEFVYIPETSMESILTEGQEKSLEEWQTEQSEIIVLKATSEIVDIDRHELVTYVLTAQEREEAEPLHLESSIETPSTETAKSETVEVVVEMEYTEEEKSEAFEQLPIPQETDTDKKLKDEVDEIVTEDVNVDKESPTESMKVKGKAKKHRKKITKVEKTITTVKTAAVEAISPTLELHRTTPEIKTVAEEGEVKEVSPQTQVTVSVYKEQVQVSTPTTESTTVEVAVKPEEGVEKAETVEDVSMVLTEVATKVVEEEERSFGLKLPAFKIPLFSATDVTIESSVDEPREATPQTVAETALQKSTEEISTVKAEITICEAEKEETKDNVDMAGTITEISVSEEKVKTPEEEETESEEWKLPSFRVPKLSLFGTSEKKAEGSSKEISPEDESKITKTEVVIESTSTTSEITDSITKSEECVYITETSVESTLVEAKEKSLQEVQTEQSEIIVLKATSEIVDIDMHELVTDSLTAQEREEAEHVHLESAIKTPSTEEAESEPMEIVAEKENIDEENSVASEQLPIPQETDTDKKLKVEVDEIVTENVDKESLTDSTKVKGKAKKHRKKITEVEKTITTVKIAAVEAISPTLELHQTIPEIKTVAEEGEVKEVSPQTQVTVSVYEEWVQVSPPTTETTTVEVAVKPEEDDEKAETVEDVSMVFSEVATTVIEEEERSFGWILPTFKISLFSATDVPTESSVDEPREATSQTVAETALQKSTEEISTVKAEITIYEAEEEETKDNIDMADTITEISVSEEKVKITEDETESESWKLPSFRLPKLSFFGTSEIKADESSKEISPKCESKITEKEVVIESTSTTKEIAASITKSEGFVYIPETSMESILVEGQEKSLEDVQIEQSEIIVLKDISEIVDIDRHELVTYVLTAQEREEAELVHLESSAELPSTETTKSETMEIVVEKEYTKGEKSEDSKQLPILQETDTDKKLKVEVDETLTEDVDIDKESPTDSMKVKGKSKKHRQKITKVEKTITTVKTAAVEAISPTLELHLTTPEIKTVAEEGEVKEVSPQTQVTVSVYKEQVQVSIPTETTTVEVAVKPEEGVEKAETVEDVSLVLSEVATTVIEEEERSLGWKLPTIKIPLFSATDVPTESSVDEPREATSQTVTETALQKSTEEISTLKAEITIYEAEKEGTKDNVDMAGTITEISVSEEKVKTPEEETESEGWKLPSFRLPKLSLFGTSEIKADEGESKITETEVVIDSTATTRAIAESITKSEEFVYIPEMSVESILVEGQEKSLQEVQTEQSEIIVSKATSEIVDIDMHELVRDVLTAQEREEAEHVHLESSIEIPSTETTKSETMELVVEKEYTEGEKSEASEQLPILQETDTDKKLKVEVDEIVTEDVDKESPTDSMKVKGKAKKHRKKITKVEKTITTVKTATVEAISPTLELHLTTPEIKTVAEEGEVREVSPQTQVTVSVYKEQVQVSTPTTETTKVEVSIKPEEDFEKAATGEDVSTFLTKMTPTAEEEKEQSFGWKLSTFNIPLFSATDVTAEFSVDESRVAAPQTFSETALQKSTEEISKVKAEITAYKTEKVETKDNLDTAGTITEISVSEEKVKTPGVETESEGWKFPSFRLPKLSLFGTSEEKAEGSSKQISPEGKSKITETEVVIESTSTASEIAASITKSEEFVYIPETSMESILVESEEKSLDEVQTEQSEIIVSKAISEIIDIDRHELVTYVLTAQEKEEAELEHLESLIEIPLTETTKSKTMELVVEKEYTKGEKSEASEQLPILQETDTDKELKVEVDEIVTEDVNVDKESPTDSMKVKGKAKKHRKKIAKVEKTITTVKTTGVEAISPMLELHLPTLEFKTIAAENEVKEFSPQTQITVSAYEEQVQISTPTTETTMVEVSVKPEESVEKAATVEDVSTETITAEEEEEKSFGWKLPTFKIPLISATDVTAVSSVDESKVATPQTFSETALQKSTEEISTVKAEITAYKTKKEETKDSLDTAGSITEISVSEEKVKTPGVETESEGWKFPSFRLPKLSLFGTSEEKAEGSSKEISPEGESKITDTEVVIDSTATTRQIAASITKSEEFVYIPEMSVESILVEGQEKSLQEVQTEQSEIIVSKATSEIVDIDMHELVRDVLTAQEREEAEHVHLEFSIEIPSTETTKSETMELVVEKEYTEGEKSEASEQLPILQETDTDKKLKVEVDEIVTEDVDKESPTDSMKVKGKAKKQRKKITKVEKIITTVKTATVEAISPTLELHLTTPEIKTVAEEGEVKEVSPQTQVTVSVYKEQVQVSTPTMETTKVEVSVKPEEDFEKAATGEDVSTVLTEVTPTAEEEKEQSFEWKLSTFKTPLFSATDVTAEFSVDESRVTASQTFSETALQKSREEISTVKAEITGYKTEKEETKDNLDTAGTITEISVSEEKVKTPEVETESEGWKFPSFRLPKLSLFGTSDVKAEGSSKEISPEGKSKITETEVVIDSTSTTSEIAASITKSEEFVYIPETSMESILVESQEKSLEEVQTEQSEIIVSKAISEIVDIDRHELVTYVLTAQEREEAELEQLESSIEIPSTETTKSETMELVVKKEYTEGEKSEASEQLPILQETDTDKELKVEEDEIVTEDVDVDKESPTDSRKVKGKAKKHRKKIAKVGETITTVKTTGVEAISSMLELHLPTLEFKTIAAENEVKEVSPQTQVTVSAYEQQVQISTPTTETTMVELSVKPEEVVEKAATVEDVSTETITEEEEEEKSFGWKLLTLKIPPFSATDVTAEFSVDESRVVAPQTFSETALQKSTEEISTMEAEITAYKTEKEETKDNLDTAGTITEISVSEEKVKTPEIETESEGWKFPSFRLPKLSFFGTSDVKAEGSSKEISPEGESKITDTEVVIDSTPTTREIAESLTKSEESVYIAEAGVESLLVGDQEKSLEELETEQSDIIISKATSDTVDINRHELVTDILKAEEREAKPVHLESALETPSTEAADFGTIKVVLEKEHSEVEKSKAFEHLPIPQQTDTDKNLNVEVDEMVTETVDIDKVSLTESTKVKDKVKKYRKQVTKVEKTTTTVKTPDIESISPTLGLHLTTAEIKTVAVEGEVKEDSPQTQVTVPVYEEQFQVSTPTTETTMVEVAVKAEEGVEKEEAAEDVSIVLTEVTTTVVEEEERSFGWKIPTFKIPLFSATDITTESSVDEQLRESTLQTFSETALQKSTEEISTMKTEITAYEVEKEKSLEEWKTEQSEIIVLKAASEIIDIDGHELVTCVLTAQRREETEPVDFESAIEIPSTETTKSETMELVVEKEYTEGEKSEQLPIFQEKTPSTEAAKSETIEVVMQKECTAEGKSEASEQLPIPQETDTDRELKVEVDKIVTEDVDVDTESLTEGVKVKGKVKKHRKKITQVEKTMTTVMTSSVEGISPTLELYPEAKEVSPQTQVTVSVFKEQVQVSTPQTTLVDAAVKAEEDIKKAEAVEEVSSPLTEETFILPGEEEVSFGWKLPAFKIPLFSATKLGRDILTAEEMEEVEPMHLDSAFDAPLTEGAKTEKMGVVMEKGKTEEKISEASEGSRIPKVPGMDKELKIEREIVTEVVDKELPTEGVKLKGKVEKREKKITRVEKTIATAQTNGVEYISPTLELNLTTPEIKTVVDEDEVKVVSPQAQITVTIYEEQVKVSTPESGTIMTDVAVETETSGKKGETVEEVSSVLTKVTFILPEEEEMSFGWKLPAFKMPLFSATEVTTESSVDDPREAAPQTVAETALQKSTEEISMVQTQITAYEANKEEHKDTVDMTDTTAEISASKGELSLFGTSDAKAEGSSKEISPDAESKITAETEVVIEATSSKTDTSEIVESITKSEECVSITKTRVESIPVEGQEKRLEEVESAYKDLQLSFQIPVLSKAKESESIVPKAISVTADIDRCELVTDVLLAEDREEAQPIFLKSTFDIPSTKAEETEIAGVVVEEVHIDVEELEASVESPISKDHDMHKELKITVHEIPTEVVDVDEESPKESVKVRGKVKKPKKKITKVEKTITTVQTTDVEAIPTMLELQPTTPEIRTVVEEGEVKEGSHQTPESETIMVEVSVKPEESVEKAEAVKEVSAVLIKVTSPVAEHEDVSPRLKMSTSSPTDVTTESSVEKPREAASKTVAETALQIFTDEISA